PACALWFVVVAPPWPGTSRLRDRAETRRPLPEVIGLRADGPHPGAAKETEDGHRYALPTLVFRGPAGCRAVPGWRPLAAYLAAVRAVCPGLAPVSDSLTPEQLLLHHRSLTGMDLPPGQEGAPAGALTVLTGTGPVYLHPDEAAGSRLLAGSGRTQP
ncbi:hypothetical protein ABZ641_32685, partial [Kitasatospora sp. NPDC007106]